MMKGFADFLGDWRLSRRIEDRLTGQVATFCGSARFVAEPASEPAMLCYDEKGQLALADGTSFEATRRYFWQFHADRVDVFFDDHRSFHHFVPEGKVAGADHLCGADLYLVTYDFTAWPSWSSVYSVKGPRKDYVSTTEFAPA